MDDIFDAISLSEALLAVGAAGVVVVGIALAFKAMGLSKRAIRHA